MPRESALPDVTESGLCRFHGVFILPARVSALPAAGMAYNERRIQLAVIFALPDPAEGDRSRG
jgi:hypothetical protein